MFITFIMFLLYNTQPRGEAIYGPALKASAQATYESSPAKTLANQGADKVKKDFPTLSKLAVTGYAIGVQHKVAITNSKISPIPNTTASVFADKHSGYVAVTWSF